MQYTASLSRASRSNERSDRRLRSPSPPSKGLLLFSSDISLPFSEVTGLLKKTANKGPRILGFKGSRDNYFVFEIFTRILEPLNP
jgi:hypothetical protein